ELFLHAADELILLIFAHAHRPDAVPVRRERRADPAAQLLPPRLVLARKAEVHHRPPDDRRVRAAAGMAVAARSPLPQPCRIHGGLYSYPVGGTNTATDSVSPRSVANGTNSANAPF